MYSFGMLKYALLVCAENTNREYSPSSRSRYPSRNFHLEFGDQRRRRTAPIGLVRELQFAGRGNIAFRLILEKLLAIRFIFVQLFAPPLHGFKAGICDCELSLNVATFC